MTTKATNDWRYERRKQAVKLKEANWTNKQIAFAVGVSESAVCQWFKQLGEAGDDPQALAPKPKSGAPPKLAFEKLAKLPSLLVKGATAYGFNNEVWTCKRVSWLIENQFGIKYHPMHVRRLLKKLGWTPQVPVEKASQRDEAAIEEWRTQTQFELKKKPTKKSD
jgi:transposase